MPEESGETTRFLDAVANGMGIRPIDLLSHKKSKKVVLARQMLAYLLRKQGFSYPEIAEKMGYKDHTGPMNSVAVFKLKMAEALVTAQLHAVTKALESTSPRTRVVMPRPLATRLEVLLRSGCYGATMEEVIERLLGHVVYQLVPLDSQVKE